MTDQQHRMVKILAYWCLQATDALSEQQTRKDKLRDALSDCENKIKEGEQLLGDIARVAEQCELRNELDAELKQEEIQCEEIRNYNEIRRGGGL